MEEENEFEGVDILLGGMITADEEEDNLVDDTLGDEGVDTLLADILAADEEEDSLVDDIFGDEEE